jgi:hypothetical protein
MEDQTISQESKFRELVKKYVPINGDDVDADLDEFFSMDYHIIFLKNNGLIGYTEHEEFIFWWYLYDAGSWENRKNIVKFAKKQQKKILYTGKLDFYRNNSVKLQDDLFQLII